MENIVDKAAEFAIRAHQNQRRKISNLPYILHPMEVASIASTMTNDEEVIAAALLHDTVEDTTVTLDEIEEAFGPYITKLVQSETEDKMKNRSASDTWQKRKEDSLIELRDSEDRNIKILWLSDKLSNMRSFYRGFLREGDAIWEHFHEKNPMKQQWYYRCVAEYTNELNDQVAWLEYNELLNRIFGGQDGTH